MSEPAPWPPDAMNAAVHLVRDEIAAAFEMFDAAGLPLDRSVTAGRIMKALEPHVVPVSVVVELCARSQQGWVAWKHNDVWRWEHPVIGDVDTMAPHLAHWHERTAGHG